MEGLLSTGPTPSSFASSSHFCFIQGCQKNNKITTTKKRSKCFQAFLQFCRKTTGLIVGSWRWKSSEVRSVGKFSGDKFAVGKKAMKKLSVPAPTT